MAVRYKCSMQTSTTEVRSQGFVLADSTATQYVILAAITLFALALRLYKLGEWSFWIDEIYTMNRAQAHYSSLADALSNLPPHTNWVPVSLLLISGALNTLGVNEWSARIVPALIGVLTIPILYLPVRSIFGSSVALVSAFLLAITPWHVSWSQNARFYSALLLFYTLAMLMIYLGLERNRPWYLILGLIFFYLAMSERIFTLFLVPVVAVYLLLVWLLPFGRPKGFNGRNLFILSVPALAGVTIELYSWMTSGSSRFFADLGWFFLYRNHTWFRLSLSIGYAISFALIGLAIFGAIVLLAEKSRIGLLLVIGALLPFAMLLAVTPFMFTQERYVFATLPCWILLAAVAIKSTADSLGNRRPWLAVALLAILVADAAGGNMLYFRVNHGNRLDWRHAFALVNERAQADDAVVAFWPEFGPYYLHREITAWDDTPVETLMHSQKRIWFVVDSETVWGDLRKKEWIEQNAQLIDVLYLSTPEDNSIRVYLYDPASVRAGAP